MYEWVCKACGFVATVPAEKEKHECPRWPVCRNCRHPKAEHVGVAFNRLVCPTATFDPQAWYDE